MIDRREFLRRTATLALTAGVSARSPVDPIPATARRLKRIGLQLYSVRAEMQRDPERTMAAVAGIGYRDVELLWSFGNFGRTVAQVRAALDNTGLSAPSAHMSAATILVGWERSLDIARTLGHSYLIVPSLPGETAGTLDDWREWADRFNAAGARAREAGIWLAFHNEPEHVRQVDGGTPLDVFIERTAPDVVRLQLDIGNMAMGGGDPIRYLERYPDRFWSFHIKDVVADGSRDTGLGMGRLPIARFLAGVSDLDAKPCFVEQEGATDPLASAAEDFAYLRNLEF